MAKIKAKIVLEELHKLWRHHTNNLKKCVKEVSTQSTKVATLTPNLKLANWSWSRTTHHTFEAKYLLDYRVLKIFNDSTLLLVTPNGKERKTNINDVKQCGTSELTENAWDLFLESIRNNSQNCTYNLRLRS